MAGGPRRLGAGAIAIVAAGIIFVVAIGFASGGDLATVFYVAPIILLGIVVVSVAAKTRAGKIHPKECSRCGGLISPHAPYCKHCGAPL